MRDMRINKDCIVRNQECKRIFGGSRICFIASPSTEEVALELEIIKQKLRDVNIEPYIAVEQREFQKDIFCEKICSKIIESLFCIVILNDVKDENGIRKPNANVYYEYGLMTAFKKKIIPIQLEGEKLAFNIQSLDTLKYNRKDFSKQIEEAIKLMLLSIEGEKEQTKEEDTYQFDWVLDVLGLVPSDDRYEYRFRRTFSLRTLGFDLYNDTKEGKLNFVGIFDENVSDKDTLLYSKILTLKVKNFCEDLQRQIDELKNEERRRPFIEERISDYEKLKNKLTTAKILVLKPTVKDPDKLKGMYIESCRDIGFYLDFEIIDKNKALRIIGE